MMAKSAPLKVLVVDDEPAIRRFLRTSLTAQGYQVSEAENGADALFRSAFTAVAGARGPALFMVAVILLGVALVSRDMKRSKDPLRGSYFVLMFLEAAVLAVGFGLVIGTITTMQTFDQIE